MRSIAKASETGHGTNIIAGVAVGMESTGPPITLIAIAILSAYQLGVTSGRAQPTIITATVFKARRSWSRNLGAVIFRRKRGGRVAC